MGQQPKTNCGVFELPCRETTQNANKNIKKKSVLDKVKTFRRAFLHFLNDVLKGFRQVFLKYFCGVF
jgi:hypothetical protein